MIDGDVSEPLRSLLEFESQKYGLPICYKQVDFRHLSLEEPFRPEIEVLVHHDDCPEQFHLPAGGEMIPVRASVHADPPGEPVGPEIGGELVPLAYLKRRQILIPFDLESLEGPRNAINRIFDQLAALALNRAVEYIRAYDWREEKARFAGVMTRALDRSIDRMTADISDNDWSIETKTNEVIELVRKNAELRECAEAIKATGYERRQENAFRSFAEMMKLTPRAYRSITFDETDLTAETGPVQIDHEGATYDLGRFRIEIGFASDTLEIHNLVPDRIIDGYHHPHVNSSGNPCLGNISLSLAKLLTAKQYVPALILTHQFLCSYSADNPYIKIERWDPDWVDDDDDYETCYENASTQVCIDCSRDGCPWWDDRYERCREFAELERCLECKDCDEWETLVENCREDKQPWECVTCGTNGCQWAGDERACRDSHNAEDCPDCDQTDCQYYPEPEEENDDDNRENTPAVP